MRASNKARAFGQSELRKLAFGEKQLEELKARLEEEAVSHRSRVGHLEEKLFLKATEGLRCR